MYEKPILSRVGKATDVIMGICSWGADLDTLFLVKTQEYEDDLDSERFDAGRIVSLSANV
jgi:hypothetical protein